MQGQGGWQRSSTPLAKNALLVLASTLFALALLEVGIRTWRSSPWGPPAAAPRMPYPAAHDPLLGYVPQANTLSVHNRWNNRVSIAADTTRSNGSNGSNRAPEPNDEVLAIPEITEITRADTGSILAVGDSFTFGDEVDDDETWPAHLERLTGRRVINGGVFGYGFDQIVLRAEQLLERLDPSPALLIVSLIADDVRRCEYSYRYAWKPWFEIEPETGDLRLHGVPVPTPDEPLPLEPAWRRWSRKSALAELLANRLSPDGGLLPESVRVHKDGMQVAERLVDRLRDRHPNLPILLVLQWDPNRADQAAFPVLARAERRGIETLRLKPILRERIGFDDSRLDELFIVQRSKNTRATDETLTRHMHDAGNRIVAELIASRLRGAAD